MKRFVAGVVVGLLVSSAGVGGAYATGLIATEDVADKPITERELTITPIELLGGVESSARAESARCSGPSDDTTVEVCAYVPEVDPIRQTIARLMLLLPI